mmetsp:Transcript_15550/g.59109  ORF Transcript_15550/g.59109 Transcript_15550/m.59109 type:complete len:158 (-) Transcript_15550:154-627(-)
MSSLASLRLRLAAPVWQSVAQRQPRGCQLTCMGSSLRGVFTAPPAQASLPPPPLRSLGLQNWRKDLAGSEAAPMGLCVNTLSEQLRLDAWSPAQGVVAPAAESGQICPLELVKRTYQPSVKRRKRRHGFLRRLRTKGGRKIMSRRIQKNRWYIGIGS